MIDKRKMNIRHVLLLLFLCQFSWFISSCEQTVGVTDGSDPVLQVDAVIYNGKPLPVIEIKQSFEMSGKDPFYVDEEELYVKIGRATSELQSRGHLVCRLLLEK